MYIANALKAELTKFLKTLVIYPFWCYTHGKCSKYEICAKLIRFHILCISHICLPLTQAENLGPFQILKYIMDYPNSLYQSGCDTLSFKKDLCSPVHKMQAKFFQMDFLGSQISLIFLVQTVENFNWLVVKITSLLVAVVTLHRTLWMLGIFHDFCHLLNFFEINLFKIFFREHNHCVMQFRFSSSQIFCWAWSGMNLLANVISRHWQVKLINKINKKPSPVNSKRKDKILCQFATSICLCYFRLC